MPFLQFSYILPSITIIKILWLLSADWQQKEKFRGVSEMTELSWLLQKLLFLKKERENFQKKTQTALMSLSACEVGVTKSLRENKKLSKTLPSILNKT